MVKPAISTERERGANSHDSASVRGLKRLFTLLKNFGQNYDKTATLKSLDFVDDTPPGTKKLTELSHRVTDWS